jgi:SAM-dependent methyltransferase
MSMQLPAPERLHSPAAERNKEPILEVLRPLLPSGGGRLLEVGSGTGIHAAHFVASVPELVVQPTDVGDEALGSLRSWFEDPEVGSGFLAPRRLDVRDRPWAVPDAPYDLVYCANVVHISPWEVGVALIEGAAEVLAPGGALVTYGPYKIDGAHTAPSNQAFDESLRARDPRWGVRDLAELLAVAEPAGFRLEARHAMPANNFTLVFRRSGAASTPR